MALSAFDDKSRSPALSELEHVLGEAAALWYQLIAHVAEHYPPMTEEWNFSGSKYGWSLRLKRRERVVLYLIPQANAFLVGIVLGEKAVNAAHKSGLPDAVAGLIDSAPRYAEGRGIRFAVAGSEDLLAAQKLAAAKMTS